MELPQTGSFEQFSTNCQDEPGLGKSTRPTNRDYELENLARDLEAVLALAAIGLRSCSDTASAG